MAFIIKEKMLYTLRGKLVKIGDNFLVLENAGFGFKVFTNSEILSKLEKNAGEITLFCFLYVREESFELYGFLEEEALKLFEMLNSVAGIGPKTALGILDIDRIENIMAAIIERRAELLTRSSGIGQKTAERIILELHSKIKLPKAGAFTRIMDINMEVEEALIGLGYPRLQVRRALSELPPESKSLEERLRQALKLLSRTK